MNAPRLAAALAACLCVAARAGDVLVEDVAHMEQYRWTRGCTPSAAAMVLSYIDTHLSGLIFRDNDYGHISQG